MNETHSKRKEDSATQVQKAMKFWPIAVFGFGLVSGGFAISADTASNAKDLKLVQERVQAAEQNIEILKQHNAVMGERSKNTQDDVKDIKQDVKDILKALRPQ